MANYDFICSIRIEAESEIDAVKLFNLITKDFTTNVMEIEVQK